MNKVLCAAICSSLLSGCVLVPASVSTAVMGGVLVATKTPPITAVDTDAGTKTHPLNKELQIAAQRTLFI